MDHKRKNKERRSRSSSIERESKRDKRKKMKHRSPSDSGGSSHGKHHKKQKQKHKHKSRSRSREKSSKNVVPDRPLTVDEMERLKAQTKRDKEMQKALETPEEKRARRLAKKEAKLRKHKEEMGWDAEYMGYTNADNPFGDERLHDTFVWNKKREKEGLKDVPRSTLERMQRQKTVENKIELEKVKKRRLEREREREERDHEREAEQRDKESEYYRVWETQEDNFHLNQAKLRSTIRIEDGRAKPIDLLAKYIRAEDDDLSLEMHEPYTYLNGLTIEDLEDLLEDIKVYREMEQGKNADYWRDITIITEDELTTLRKIDPSVAGFAGERRSGINTSVSEDVVSVFKGKTLAQLALLGQQIEKKLSSGQGIDVGYWESLRQQLHAHMARTRLREKHGEQLRRRLFKLKEEQGISETKPLFPIAHEPSTSSSQSAVGMATRAESPQVEPDSTTPDPGTPIKQEFRTPGTPLKEEPGSSVKEEPGTSVMEEPGTSTQDGEGGQEVQEESQSEGEEETLITEEDLTSQQYDDYIQGGYSPKLLRPSELEADTIVYDPEDDIRRLEYARVRMQRIGKAKEETDREFEKLAREGMNNDEAQFSVEVPLEKQVLLWSDKYRPRKPRFFNRVHTGFEWNKYNQTHYDIDNPPPKIVQGYKFNIFYPDLIDKTKTPEYFLTPCADNTDFAILRFHTGPPYEDIAFKIVNREWEYSYKRGFRCQFHNNIFQLWYHFKRYRYRR